MAELNLTHFQDIWGNWTDSREMSLRNAEEWARRAIENDPAEPLGHMALGLVYQLQPRNDQAIPLLEKAHNLNPNDYHIIFSYGYALTYSGDPERGIELIAEAQRLNPAHSETSMRDLAMAYFYAGQYANAIEVLNKISRRHRKSYRICKAASHAQLGQLGWAQKSVEEALRLNPDLNLEDEIGRRIDNGLSGANAQILRESLRMAGFPEKTQAPGE